MRTTLGCMPCFIKQAINCMNIAGITDEQYKLKVVHKLFDEIKTYSMEDDPAYSSSLVFLKTYELIGNNDPYAAAKKETNEMALKLYPRLKEKVETSVNKLDTALKISVSGNVIDLGIQTSFDIEEALAQSFEVGFGINHYNILEEKLKTASNIIILGDNAGEIVFDKVLVETLLNLGFNVKYVVKSAPILNDATMEDAKFVGMTEIVTVLENGSNILGTNMKCISKDIIEELKNADIIISKGQANFETLEDCEMVKGKIFFVLKIKCEFVGITANANFGEVVLISK